ncbi:hypothetical protein R6Q59_033391 [Mikania micrantha]
MISLLMMTKEEMTPEREELAESSVGASKEEEPENIILDNISTDPYIYYLYIHKYVDAFGHEVTSHGKVIESWFDKKVKKEPWIYYRYPPPATKKVPVPSRVPNNMMNNFDLWYFDEKTHATVIMKTKGDLNYLDIILDPMDLLNFEKDDMQALHDNPIRTYGGWDEEAKLFAQVVALAMSLKLYAGAGPHSMMLAID